MTYFLRSSDDEDSVIDGTVDIVCAWQRCRRIDDELMYGLLWQACSSRCRRRHGSVDARAKKELKELIAGKKNRKPLHGRIVSRLELHGVQVWLLPEISWSVGYSARPNEQLCRGLLSGREYYLQSPGNRYQYHELRYWPATWRMINKINNYAQRSRSAQTKHSVRRGVTEVLGSRKRRGKKRKIY